MDGKGALSIRPVRQSRRVAILAGAWLGVILVLGFWWATIVLHQAERIAELSEMAGVPAEEVLAETNRVQRMLFWESGTFLVLLLMLSAALFWYYRRDMQRARGTQAFFAALTHELRTPLTSVRLQTEAIAAGEPTQELIERLLADTHRLESQIDKTLELARIEGGGRLAGALLGHGLVDRHYWIQSPLWLGERGIPAFADLPGDPIARAHRWTVVDRRAPFENSPP